MGTLTISSGVLENDDVSTTSRFTSVTLVSTSGDDPRDKEYPQSIVGAADLVQPIVFSVQRPIRTKMRDDLIPIATTFIARAPRRTRSGFYDAVIDADAELVNFAWSELDRTTTGGSAAVDEWGFFQIIRPTIRGTRETLDLVLFPVDKVVLMDQAGTTLTRPGVT